MNPMFVEAVLSILRWLLAGAAGLLVEHSIWTQADASRYVAAGAMAVLSLGWSIWQKYKSRLKLVTALSMSSPTTETQVDQKIATGVNIPSVTSAKDVVPMAALLLAVALTVVGSACVHARHAAVVADKGFAAVVFALDDAEYNACVQHAPGFTDSFCAKDAPANTAIKKALTDVGTVTAAIQATPTNVALPKGLPDLMKDLTDAQKILVPLTSGTNLPAPVQSVAMALQNAVDKALALLASFGGQ